MRVAMVGCGPLGRDRATSLGSANLVAVWDPQNYRAVPLAAEHAGCSVEADAVRCVQRDDIDAVVLADDACASFALAAVEAGKHILIDQPSALSTQDLTVVLARAERNHVVVKVGFHHRHYPAIQKARKLVDRGKLGPLYYVRGRLSHQGEVVDQYSHLIDLARWFLGDFSKVQGRVGTCFWDMPVDDNGFLFLRTPTECMAWLHVDSSDWLNPIHVEIFGRGGKLEIDGFANLRFLPNGRNPTGWSFSTEDLAKELEFAHFQECIANGHTPMGSLADALAAIRIIQQLDHAAPTSGWERRLAA